MKIAEKRGFQMPIELRAEGSSMIAGYAAIFNSPTDIGGWFSEVIAPGAFSETLDADVRALHEHDPARLLGRTTAGTLRINQDAKGLAVEIDLPDTQAGRDLLVSVQRGDISGMSFGFRVNAESWDDLNAQYPIRTVESVDLFEVSAVAFPAYADTSIALRSLTEARSAMGIKTFSGAALRLQRTANLEQRIRRLAH